MKIKFLGLLCEENNDNNKKQKQGINFKINSVLSRYELFLLSWFINPLILNFVSDV